VRYSLINKSGEFRLTAVGSPCSGQGDGSKLILDLAAQQRLRTLLLAPLIATRLANLERAGVRQSGCHAPDPGSFGLSRVAQCLGAAAELGRPGLAFSWSGIAGVNSRPADIRIGVLDL
jgi:hypothetical protein